MSPAPPNTYATWHNEAVLMSHHSTGAVKELERFFQNLNLNSEKKLIIPTTRSSPKYFVNQTFGNRCQNVSVTERNGNNALKAWMSQQPWQILPTSSNYSRLKRTYSVNIWEGDLA